MRLNRGLSPIILIAIFAFGSSFADNRPQKTEQAQPVHQATNDKKQEIPSSVSSINPQRANSNTYSGNHESQKETDSEGRLVFWTAGLVFVGALQLFLFFWQLWLINASTKDAADAARAATESAKTASQALKLSRETSNKQLRAYIGVDEMEDPDRRHVAFPFDREEGIMEAHVIAKNYGSTPALRVKIGTRFKYLESPPTEEMFPNTEYGGHGTIHPNNNLIIRLNEKTPKLIWDNIKTNIGSRLGKYLYAFGYVSYFDIFGQDHFTRFCLKVEYRNGSPSPPGWILEGPFNDTDDDKPANLN